MSRIDGTTVRSNVYDASTNADDTRSARPSSRGTPPRGDDARLERHFSRATDSPHYLTSLTNLASPVRADTVAIDAAAIDPGDRVRAKLDAFRDRFSGPYMVDGQVANARPMFRMNGSGFNQKKMEAHLPELSRICARAKVDGAAVMAAAIGRCTPEQLVKVTQALIDAGKLPPPPGAADERVRKMQWEWGIGVDCAGYTARAAQAAHGHAAAALIGNDKDYFAQMMRDRAHFARVGVADIRAGDIIHLDPPAPGSVGHNVIVHSHTVVGSSASAELAGRARGAAAFLAGPGPFHAITVDSSWGAGEAGADYGGFRRDTWIHDEHSGKWGHFTPTTPSAFLVSERGPQDEPFGGAYRPRGGA